MARSLLILLSFLLAFTPVASAFTSPAQHGDMQLSGMQMQESAMKACCMEIEASSSDKSCFEASQCDKNCKTMQCSTTGHFSALSLMDNAFSTALAVVKGRLSMSHAPVTGIYGPLLRPPIAHL